MPAVERILVGIDLTAENSWSISEPSEASWQAAEQAIWLAHRTGATLTFLAALPEILDPQASYDLTGGSSHISPHVLHEARVMTEGLREDAVSMLDNVQQRAAHTGCVATTVLTYGRAWLELIRTATVGRYGLVMVGSRESGGLQRMLLGSTAARLLRNCPIPVWVTRPCTRVEVASIVAATDFSPPAATSTDLAVELAMACFAQLHLVHAFREPISSRLWNSQRSPLQREAAYRDALENAKALMSAEVRRLEKLGDVASLRTHLKHGTPVEAVLQSVVEQKADLLVLGSVGRSGLPGVLLGNTAERVLREVSCPVLVVKPDDFECPVPLNEVRRGQDVEGAIPEEHLT